MPTVQRYARGEKWCRTCQIFVKADSLDPRGLYHLSCGYRVRSIPERKKFRTKFKEVARY